METPATFEHPTYADAGPALEQVSSGVRFMNYIIDVVAVLGLGFMVGVVAVLLGFDAFIESLDGPLMSRLIGVVLTIIYYLTLETLSGRTLGKLVTGTKVVMEDGSKPAFAAILKRTLWRCVPFEAFTFFGDASGWHDAKSHTTVVRTRR